MQVGEEVERALAKFAPPKVGVRYAARSSSFFQIFIFLGQVHIFAVKSIDVPDRFRIATQSDSVSAFLTLIFEFGVCRSSPKRIQGPDQQNLRLQFRNKLALPLFTGSKVEGEQGSAIHVVLQHAGTGQVVTTGPEASAKLDIVVLEGDFTAEDEDNWTQEEFENFEVRERDGKRPLLTGDLSVALKDGVGTLGELTFTDNSSWIDLGKWDVEQDVGGHSGARQDLRFEWEIARVLCRREAEYWRYIQQHFPAHGAYR